MARKNSSTKSGRAAARRAAARQAAEAPPAPRRQAEFIAGVVALIVAAGASGMLVLNHLVGMTLPGCGPGSGCAALASSAWGSVPGVGWPVSHVGLAYFVAMLFAWLLAGRRMTASLLWTIRLGAALSVVFLVAMFLVERHFCLYCFIAHLGNFAFWIAAERAPRAAPTANPMRPIVAAAGLFLISTAALFGVETATEERVEADNEEQRQASVRQLANQTGENDDEGFTGRWLLGPENAAIRIVLLSDFQCPDCYRVEMQVRQIMEERDDVSVSAKHFPMSSQCNPYFPGELHPNACWAARAAETAGRLRGNDGFWEFHHWLFDRRGSFTRDELIAYLQEQGYDADEFIEIMNSEEILALVQADIEEGRDLGLHFTPMVFVNGVEMKGITVRDGLIKTVSDVAATNPQPRSAAADVPPDAAQKYFDDWEASPERRIPDVDEAWSRGAGDDAAVEIVIWGDLQEPNTGRLHDRIMQAIAERGDVSYRFLHYPMNNACNPEIESAPYPMSCVAAQAAEAAGILDGTEGYWRMHDWLVANREGLTLERVQQAAGSLGFDADALRREMENPAVGVRIAQNARAGKRMGTRFIPTVYVNRKWVPRWSLQGEDIMGRIIEAAAEE